MSSTDWTDEQRLMVMALSVLCKPEARKLDDAVTELEKLTDMPDFLRMRLGTRGSITWAEDRVKRAHRALEAKRDEVAVWGSHEVGRA